MCLKGLLCGHKKLTAMRAFIEKQRDWADATRAGYEEPTIVLKCDKCGKLFKMLLHDMQVARHNFRIEVDTTLLEKYDFFGGDQQVEEE